MALRTEQQLFKDKSRDIKYLNKDFVAFRRNIIEFSKTYFPKTYADFNESSPGMLFIEMASYIGDVLSYYVDDTLKESMMIHAEDIANVLSLAQYLGYKPKVTSPATTTLSVYQLVPAIDNGNGIEPDKRFFLRIKEGMEVTSQSTDITFRTTDVVDFSEDVDREISVYLTDNNTGDPTFFIIRKQVQAISATEQTKTVTFGDFRPFPTITLPETNVIHITDIRDENGRKYYEVPYLGQEMIFLEEPNTERFHPDLYQFRETVPMVLRTLRTPNRFISRIDENSTTIVTFGAGDERSFDEQLIPNFKNVGLGLPNSIDRLGQAYDPTNFLKTKTYGVAPSNTEVIVTYLVGGGVETNVPAEDLTSISLIDFDDDISSFDAQDRRLYREAVQSVAVSNDIPATGGRGGETIEEIRQNALAHFSSQNRAVTAKDYTVRTLSMPPRYGSVSKAFAAADGVLDNNSPSSILASPNSLQQFSDLVLSFVNREDEDVTEEMVKEDIRNFLIGKQDNVDEKNNPFAVNLYVLGYDGDKKLVPVNRAVKENIRTYLNEYRMLTDGVNLIDGFVINIGIDFEITVYPNYNKSEVILECIDLLKDYFDIDNWTFNRTINTAEVEMLLTNLEGVQSVSKLEFVNKFGAEYAPHTYNIHAATKDKIIYPSLDPSVFEIKFPDKDIRGRAR